MSNQLQITGGGKVRNLEGVITGTSGVLSSVPLGAANGVATLDSGGKVPVSQLPSSVVTYLGTWNAATNTPTLANGTGDAGDMYLCNVAGTVNFGAGPVVFVIGDWVLYGSGTWQKSNGQNGTVTSVGLSTNAGAITIGSSPITTSGTITANFNGTNLQYVNGAGNLTTFPILTGYVPYTGATQAVNLGAYDLTVNNLTIGKGTSALSNNSALGYRALFHITTGNYNTAVGYESAHNTTTGQYNTALGQSALFTNTTGSQNTALGLNALLNNTTGGSNVVVGLDALQHNTTGSSNTALGYNAGSHITGGATPNTTASNSIYIGRDTRANVDGGTNEIVIGNTVTGNGSNTVTIGNSSITANYFKGSINADSFVKSGGTSSQFLKADGTVDTSTYYLASNPSAFIALTALSFVAGSGAYNSTTGVITIPTNNNQITNGAGYTTNVGTVTSVAATGGTGISITGSPITTSGTITITNTAPDQTVSLTASTGISVTGTYPNFTITNTSPSSGGTVTSVAALTLGTSGTDLSSTVANSTTTPVITLNVPTASATNRGALSSADFTTFNNKYNLPSLTSGSVLFSNGSTIAQDNANFFWDDTNNRLGIGTTTPYHTLQVSNSANFGAALKVSDVSTQSTGAIALGDGSSSTLGIGMWRAAENSYTTQGNWLNIQGISGIAFMSGTGAFGSNTQRMTLTSTGNLGIGVTPSAWAAGGGNLQLKSGVNISWSGQDGYLAANQYYNGTSSIYISNGYATQYAQEAGIHKWLISPSGTAGNAITFTQAMTLNASGNLGIGSGATSPQAALHITGAISAAPAADGVLIGVQSDYAVIHLNGSSITGSLIDFSTNGTDHKGRIEYNNTTNDMTIGTNATQRMRIFSDGNVLLQSGGTFTNNGYKLDVNGTGRFSGALTGTSATFSTSLALTKNSNSSTAISITNTDAGSSAIAEYTLTTDSSGFAAFGKNSSTRDGAGIIDPSDTFIYSEKGNISIFNNFSSGAIRFAAGASSTAQFTIASTGAATFSSSVTATSFFESSDSRLKTLIQDNYQTKGIASITPKLYTKNGKVELGYYAQDFVGILDSAVSKGSDDMLSLSYREVLVAKVYALEQRIKELETK